MATLVVANWRDSSHPRAGGAELCCEEVARRLADAGHRVVYLTAAAPGSPPIEERDGFQVVRRGGQYGVYPALLWWLFRHRRSVDGVIDSQNGIPFFAPLALRRATPVVLLLHHIHQQQFSHYLPAPAAAVARWLEASGCRWVYRNRVVAAVSPSTRTGARRELGLRGPIHVVPLGMTAPPDRTAAPRARRSPEPLVVCVGRMVPHKRYELVVAAFARVLAAHPRARLLMIGDGPDRARLEQAARDAGLGTAVRFTGVLSASERDAAIARAWVTVNPSQGEGWGLSVLEANTLGVPAVAFDVPGLRDSIRSGSTGWLVAPGGDLGGQIAEALTILSEPGVGDSMAAATRAWSAKFDWARTTDMLAGLLDAERDRLALGSERRHLSDLAMVADVPLDALPDGWVPAMRRSDRVVLGPASVTMLLHSCDTAAAQAALNRTGVPEVVVARAAEIFRVARAVDYLFPSPVPAPAPVGDRAGSAAVRDGGVRPAEGGVSAPGAVAPLA